MKKFTLVITNLVNAAFGDGVDEMERDEEIARILIGTATRIRSFGCSAIHTNLRDSNGNIVGTQVLREESK